MCKYLVQVKMNFGNMSVSAGDNYQEAINKYHEIKEYYNSIPCEISFYNKEKDDVQFTKVNKDDSFDKLYNDLINNLANISRHMVDIRRRESNLTEVRNEMYHALELTSLSDLTEEEQLKMLFDMKAKLSSRRLIEDESQKMYAFFDSFKDICNLISKYDNEKESKLRHGQKRFGNAYYSEDLSNKKQRTKKLLSTLEK